MCECECAVVVCVRYACSCFQTTHNCSHTREMRVLKRVSRYLGNRVTVLLQLRPAGSTDTDLFRRHNETINNINIALVVCSNSGWFPVIRTDISSCSLSPSSIYQHN